MELSDPKFYVHFNKDVSPNLANKRITWNKNTGMAQGEVRQQQMEGHGSIRAKSLWAKPSRGELPS